MYYVLIGDMVNSRRQYDRPAIQKDFLAVLDRLNREYQNDLAAFLTVTGGDEFQGLFREGENILRLILQLSSALQPVSFRFGLGYGPLATPVNKQNILAVDGPAFHLARGGLTEAKKNRLCFVLKGFPSDREEAVNLVGRLFFNSLAELSPKQRTAVGLMLKFNSQKEVADHLGISKSAVSQRLKGARWKDLQVSGLWLQRQLALPSAEPPAAAGKSLV